MCTHQTEAVTEAVMKGGTQLNARAPGSHQPYYCVCTQYMLQIAKH